MSSTAQAIGLSDKPAADVVSASSVPSKVLHPDAWPDTRIAAAVTRYAGGDIWRQRWTRANRIGKRSAWSQTLRACGGIAAAVAFAVIHVPAVAVLAGIYVVFPVWKLVRMYELREFDRQSRDAYVLSEWLHMVSRDVGLAMFGARKRPREATRGFPMGLHVALPIHLAFTALKLVAGAADRMDASSQFTADSARVRDPQLYRDAISELARLEDELGRREDPQGKASTPRTSSTADLANVTHGAIAVIQARRPSEEQPLQN